MKQPQTRQTTLYRLVPEIDGTSHESLFDSVTEHESIKELDPPEILTIAGCPALFFGVQEPLGPASWCADASATTGLPLSYTSCRSGGLLILGVDSVAYARSYDRGYLLLPDGLKDQGFGLSFQIRSLDADQVNNIVRRRPDAKGRTDATSIAVGAQAWTLATVGSAEIIRRIGGKAKDLKVTFRGKAGQQIKVEGAAGLTMRFGLDAEDFVADIRECARICDEVEPDPALRFVEHVHQVTDTVLKDLLFDELDMLLGADGSDGDADRRLLPIVPTSLLDRHGSAHSITISIYSTRVVPTSEFGLSDLLRCVKNRRPGRRVSALKSGKVSLNGDDSGLDVLGGTSALKWLEATVTDGAERYFLMDGDWFRIGDDYVRNARVVIESLFPDRPSVTLPPWSADMTERFYNEHVADIRPGQFLCLDRDQRVRHPYGPSTSSLEICDLLGPNDELIHVKRAKGSAPLSHLFQQGLQGAQGLLHGPAHVRERFVSSVANRRHGRELDPDFRPRKLIYAILLENGQTLDADTLFPFSQAALAHAANILGANVEIEVIGIPPG